MPNEIVSKKTRNEFREFLVGWTLREIEMEFDAADIPCHPSEGLNLPSGARRGLVEQYYASRVPLDLIKQVGVYNAAKAAEVQEIFDDANIKIPVEVKRDWYF